MARVGRAYSTAAELVATTAVALSLALACLWFLPSQALAAGAAEGQVESKKRYRVVLARPTDAEPIAIEALTRVSGELEAAGFDIRTVPINRDADARSTVEAIGRELAPVAAFAIFPGPSSPGGASTAEIWVSDRLTGRATVQRLVVNPRDTNRSAAVLAVHAVELLKASLAELWEDDSTRRRPAPAVELPVEAPPSPGRAYVLSGFSVEAAGGVLAHAAGFAAGWTPALRVSFGMPSGFAVRLGAVGAGEVLQISQDGVGVARLRQQMLTIDVVAAFRAFRRVQPIATVAAGAYRLGVSGTADPGSSFVSRSDQSWAVVAGVGGGVVVAVVDHLAFTADLQALGFLPRPVVHLGDTEVGQVGKPAFLMSAGLIGLF